LIRNAGSNFPFRAGKDTLWEGGVKGVGFVYTANDLIKHKKRVCMGLIDATDWAATLYHLGGGDAELISARTDGKNVWETISYDAPSPRDEVLHNIDPRYVQIIPLSVLVGGQRVHANFARVHISFLIPLLI